MAISSALGSSALLPAGLGFRNKIINGDFRINQRAFTSTTTSGTFGFDRWQIGLSGGTVTYSAQTFTPGNAIPGQEPTNYARVVTSGHSASTDSALLIHKIEDVRNCAGQTATISFWAQAASGTPKVAVQISQSFGTGGSPSADVDTYVGQATLSTSWTMYKFTFVVPSISGKTIGTTANTSFLRLNLWTSAGSNNNASTGSLGVQNATINFWGVQLEQNYQPTPFEQRPIGVELALCQRYYETSNGLVQVTGGATGFGGNTYWGWVGYKVEKRIALNLVTNNTSNGVRVFATDGGSDYITMWKAATQYYSVAENFEAWTTQGFGINTTSGQVDAGLARFFWNANAEL